MKCAVLPRLLVRIRGRLLQERWRSRVYPVLLELPIRRPLLTKDAVSVGNRSGINCQYENCRDVRTVATMRDVATMRSVN